MASLEIELENAKYRSTESSAESVRLKGDVEKMRQAEIIHTKTIAMMEAKISSSNDFMGSATLKVIWSREKIRFHGGHITDNDNGLPIIYLSG